MKDILKKLVASFDNSKHGFSSRKLTAFIITACIVVAHIKWITLGDFSQLENVFLIDYGFIAALFGMTTYSNLKGKDEKSPE